MTMQRASRKQGSSRRADDFGEHGGFGGAAFLIETLQLRGEFVGAGFVARGEELDDFGGDVHAAGGVDAGREAEGDVDGRERATGRIDLRFAHQGSQAESDGTAQFGEAERDEDTIFAEQRNGIGDGGDGQHLEERGQNFRPRSFEVPGFEQGLGKLERDSGTAEMSGRRIGSRAGSD